MLHSVHLQKDRARRGNAALTMIIAGAMFAGLLSFLYFRSAPEANQPAQQVSKSSQISTENSTKTDLPADNQVAQTQTKTSAEIVIDDPAGTVPPAKTTTTVASKEIASTQVGSLRLELVTAQLEAGEFGPALETAKSATDAQEKTDLLKLVADAQLDSGEFDSALQAIRRLPIPEERRAAHGKRATEEMLAGGGALADFTQLIELIQQETSGPWEDIDPPGGTISEYNTGVRVDPNGLLARLTSEEKSEKLDQLADQVRVADLNEDMAKPSSLRLVSLTRLEKAVAQRIANGEPVVTSMQHLAGLSSIQYVFVMPETGEIIIGGPAEGWQYNNEGRPVGVTTKRPTMQLDDLVTVLRTFSKDGLGIFTCSIVPRQEGLKNLKTFVEASNAKGPLTPSGTKRWAEKMEQELGKQNIVYEGIPVDSRVARVIIEADYRMKLIGVDKLQVKLPTGQNIQSFFDLLPKDPAKQPNRLDALRWWLTMKYDSVLHSTDRNVFEIRGSSVKCLSENELINDLGQRVQTGKTDETNRMFALNFTNNYAEIAKQDLVFADLQNIFDLALVAALVRQQRLDERANWDLGSFAENGAYEPKQYPAPQTVDSVVNYRTYAGGNIVAQVAGGVRADLMAVVRNQEILQETARLQNFKSKAEAPQLPEGRWWWDAPAK